MGYKTEQEGFWSGPFGSEYIQRNQGADLLASNLVFFGKALRCVDELTSCVEFGANIGMNVQALQLLYPQASLSAVEINKAAVEELRKHLPTEQVFHQSILEFRPDRTWDLVFTKGVLIHINPDELETVYNSLVSACSRFLLIAEYYNPSPVSIPYRGYEDRLFKRDFAGEILEKFSEFRLRDYGFAYHRDPNFPQDDISWFLLERKGA